MEKEIGEFVPSQVYIEHSWRCNENIWALQKEVKTLRIVSIWQSIALIFIGIHILLTGIF